MFPQYPPLTIHEENNKYYVDFIVLSLDVKLRTNNKIFYINNKIKITTENKEDLLQYVEWGRRGWLRDNL